jgi:hypothetical protein
LTALELVNNSIGDAGGNGHKGGVEGEQYVDDTRSTSHLTAGTNKVRGGVFHNNMLLKFIFYHNHPIKKKIKIIAITKQKRKKKGKFYPSFTTSGENASG